MNSTSFLALGRGGTRNHPSKALTLVALLSLLAVTSASGWEAIGPGGGGWIQDVEWSPSGRDTIYVAGDVSGVLVSNDAGNSFSPLNIGLGDYFVQSITEAGVGVSKQLLAGTMGGVYRHDLNSNSRWIVARDGFPPRARYSYSMPVSVVRAMPNGEIIAGIGAPRWQKHGQSAVMVTNQAMQRWKRINLDDKRKDLIVTDILAEYGEGSEVLAASNGGMFRSSDAGRTWKLVDGPLVHEHVTALAGARGSNIVYAATLSPRRSQVSSKLEARADTPGAVYRSENGGISWRKLEAKGLGKTVGRGNSLARQTSGYSKLAVDPSNVDTVYLGDDSWVTGGVYKSSDKGESWKKILSLSVVDRLKGNSQKVGWINAWAVNVTALDVSPLDSSLVAVGTSGHLIVSRDAGASWANAFSAEKSRNLFIGNGLETMVVNDLALTGPKNPQLLACYADAGLFVSAPPTYKAFSLTTQATSGLVSCLRVAIDPERDSHYWGLLRPNGGPHKSLIIESSDAGDNWQIFPVPGSVDGAIVDFTVAYRGDERLLLGATDQGEIVVSDSDGHGWDKLTNKFGGEKANHAVTKIASAGARRNIVIAAVRGERGRHQIVLSNLSGDRAWRQVKCASTIGEVTRIRTNPNDSSLILVSARSTSPGRSTIGSDGGVFEVNVESLKCTKRFSRDFISDATRIGKTEVIAAASNQHPFFDGASGDGVFIIGDEGLEEKVSTGKFISNNVTVLQYTEDSGLLFAGTNGNGIMLVRTR